MSQGPTLVVVFGVTCVSGRKNLCGQRHSAECDRVALNYVVLGITEYEGLEILVFYRRLLDSPAIAKLSH